MIQRTIVLPNYDNESNPLVHEHSEFQAFLLNVAGGYSVEKQQGAWKDKSTGRVYFDESQRYTVVVSAQADKVIAAYIPLLCERTRQECILTTSARVSVSFVQPLTKRLEEAS